MSTRRPDSLTFDQLIALAHQNCRDEVRIFTKQRRSQRALALRARLITQASKCLLAAEAQLRRVKKGGA